MEATTSSSCSLFVWRGVFTQEAISRLDSRTGGASSSSWASILNQREERRNYDDNSGPVRLQRVRDRTTCSDGESIRDRNLTVLLSPQDHVHVYIGKRAVVFSNNHGVCLSSLELNKIFGASLEEKRGSFRSEEVEEPQEPKIPFELEVDRALFDPVIQSSTALAPMSSMSGGQHSYGPSQLNLIAFSFNAPSSSSAPAEGQQEFEIYTLEGESITMHRLQHALSYQWSLVNAEASMQRTIQESNNKSLTTMTLKTLHPDKMLMSEAAQARYGVSRTLVAAPNPGAAAASGYSNLNEYDGVPSLSAPSPLSHVPFPAQQYHHNQQQEQQQQSPPQRAHPKFVITKPRSPSPTRQRRAVEVDHDSQIYGKWDDGERNRLSPDRIAGRGGATDQRSGQRDRRQGYPLSGSQSPPRRATYTKDLGPLKPEGTKGYVNTPMPSHSDYHHSKKSPGIYHQQHPGGGGDPHATNSSSKPYSHNVRMQLPPNFDELHHVQSSRSPYVNSSSSVVVKGGYPQGAPSGQREEVSAKQRPKQLQLHTAPMPERGEDDPSRGNLTFTPAQQKLVSGEIQGRDLGTPTSTHNHPSPSHHQARVYQSSLRKPSSAASVVLSRNPGGDQSFGQHTTPTTSSSIMTMKKSVSFTHDGQPPPSPYAGGGYHHPPVQAQTPTAQVQKEEDEVLMIQCGACGQSIPLRDRYEHMRACNTAPPLVPTSTSAASCAAETPTQGSAAPEYFYQGD